VCPPGATTSPASAANQSSAILRTSIARDLGVRLVEVTTRELDRTDYRANGPDRCFHCKDELFSTIDAQIVRSERLGAIAYGENADDARRPDRPGSRAASEHRVLRPLADLDLSKADVRRLARELGLASADKPAAPCLASRIPHFTEVTPRKLRQIEEAEAALRRVGFQDFRVRHHGDVARLELPAADLIRAVSEPLRSAVQAAVLAAGFRFVTVDLAGIQSGAFTLPLVIGAPGE
jgi:uncharacterized protein